MTLRNSFSAFVLLLLLGLASPSAAQLNEQQGVWSLGERWFRDGSTGRFAAVLASTDVSHVYRICRDGASTAGVQSAELRVLVDANRIPNYSLDHGSCIIVKGQNISVVYEGSVISAGRLLRGSYARLDEADLVRQTYRKVADWSFDVTETEAGLHDMRLVDGVPGDYRVCFNGTEIGLTTGQPSRQPVTVKVIRDESDFVDVGGQQATFRQLACVDVEGQTLELQLNTVPNNLLFFRMRGSLWLRSDRIDER